jgi:restriction endonuclease S subunit
MVVRPFNLLDFKVENTNLVYISENDIVKKGLKLFKKGTLFFSRVGDVRCSVLTQNEVTISPNIIAAELNNEQYSPYFLSIFFNSRFGILQILRAVKTVAQPTISTDTVRRLKLPEISKQFQNQCEKLLLSAFEIEIKSQEFYHQAEDLLLSELGLKNWQPTEETVAVKSFSESFLSSDRLDTEYYQPKQQKVMAIMGQSGLCIGDVVSLVKRKFQPEKQGTFNYIEIGNLSGEGFANSEVVAMEEAPSRAQWFVKTNDVITSTVRPIRRLSALIESEQNNYICSSGFAVLKPTKIEPEVLLVYLRSPIVCEILDLHTIASMYPAISTEDLLKIPITLPKESTRQKITEKVRESRKSREQSKQLLEIAKTGVERAIETDEATATVWINQQLEALYQFNVKLHISRSP